jgi:hypothetical protein
MRASAHACEQIFFVLYWVRVHVKNIRIGVRQHQKMVECSKDIFELLTRFVCLGK